MMVLFRKYFLNQTFDKTIFKRDTLLRLQIVAIEKLFVMKVLRIPIKCARSGLLT